jgi:hypothetical protein
VVPGFGGYFYFGARQPVKIEVTPGDGVPPGPRALLNAPYAGISRCTEVVGFVSVVQCDKLMSPRPWATSRSGPNTHIPSPKTLKVPLASFEVTTKTCAFTGRALTRNM